MFGYLNAEFLMFTSSKKPNDCLFFDLGEPYGTWQESWKAMEHAHREGKIRSLGVSNFKLPDLRELQKLAEIPVSVVQNWFDPIHQDTRIRKFCSNANIRYMGYSTLGTYAPLIEMAFIYPAFSRVLPFLSVVSCC